MFLLAFDSRARASNFGFTNRDPYSEEAWQEDGKNLFRGEVYEDEAIAMTFALGDLLPEESVTFTYYTSLNGDLEAGLDEIIHNIALTGNSVAEFSPPGTIVGHLDLTSTNDDGEHAFTLIDNAGGRFALEGNNIVVNEGDLLNASEATSHTITVQLSCSNEEKIYEKSFVISVLPAPLPKLPLQPVFEGWTMNPDETYTAHWGWKNEIPRLITVPLGEDNQFTGNPLGGAMDPVIEFVYGRVYNAFETKFDGSNLVWSLKGPDGKIRTATASSAGPAFDTTRYLPVRPVLEGVTWNVYSSVYTSWWGWKNECDFVVTVPYEHSKFTGEREGNPPNQFTAGRVYAAFAVPFDGNNLVWSLRGPDGKTRTATASKDSKLLVDLIPDRVEYTLKQGANQQIQLTGKFITKGVESTEDITNKIKYQVITPDLIDVTDGGFVTAKASGLATIKVTYWGMEKIITINITSGSGSSSGSSYSGPAVSGLTDGSILDRMPGYIPLSSPVSIDVERDQVTLEYNLEKLSMNPNHSARIYYWNGKVQKWVALATYPEGERKVKAINAGKHMGWFAVFGVREPHFTDVSGNWAEPVVNRMNGLGMIEGYGDMNGQSRQARLEGQITRVELAMFIYRLLNINHNDPQITLPDDKMQEILKAKFTDASTIPAWAQKAVAALVQAGVVTGRGQKFDAGEPITRIEAAVMISNALEKVSNFKAADLIKYADAAVIPDWARGAVDERVILGYIDGTLRSNDFLTRAEGLTMLDRLFVVGMGW